MTEVISRARLLGGELVDVHLADGVIAAVRPSEGETHVHDADGALLLPGLWDAHVHFGTHALLQHAVPLAAGISPDDTVATLESAPGRSFVGFGFLAAAWPDPPQAEAGGGRPLVAIGGDLHSVWLNDAAAAWLRLERAGLVVESEAFRVISALKDSGAEHVEAGWASTMAAASAAGVVGIVDLDADWAVGRWRDIARRGALPFHVDAGTYPADLERLIDAGLRTGDVVADGLRAGPLKIIADGSMGSRSAECRVPYPDPIPGHEHGLANVGDAELDRLLTRATAHGVAVAVHAIGDRALSRVLDSIHRTGASGSIEHAQWVDPSDLHRFAELGVTASVQPAHLRADEPVIPQVWPTAGGRAFPFRSLLDAEARLTLGSDAPVAPLNPWLAMDAAVNRRHHPEQALTPVEALAASTRTTLAEGQAADLVLVDRAPAHLLDGHFEDTTVLATWLAGRLTHQA